MKNVLSMRLLQFLAALCLLSVIPANAAQSGDFTYTATTTEVTITGYTGAGGAVVIPASINGTPVTAIGEAAFSPGYRGNQSIISVTIPDSVTRIGDYAFSECRSLAFVAIPDSVSSIGQGAFSECSDLTSVTIPDSVMSIEFYAFAGCSGLTSVTIGSGVTSIGNSAFVACIGLTSVTIPASVTSIGGGAFFACSGLTNLEVDSTNLNYTSVGGDLYNKDQTTLILCPAGKSGSYTIPNSVTSIGGNAFARCSGLTSVTIGSGVTSIGGGAFSECSGLTSVTIPNNVTSIELYAFARCSGLTSVTIGSGVTSIGDFAFDDCSGITHFVFTGNAPTLEAESFSGVPFDATVRYSSAATGWGATFGGLAAVADYLDVLTYSTANNQVTITGYTGTGGVVIIPASIGGVPVTAIGEAVFSPDYQGIQSITSVTIPDSVTSIGGYAFNGCSGLTSVFIPAVVTSIGDSAFQDCSGLTSVTIPDIVTSIGNGAFQGCTGLSSVTIGSGVTSIGGNAFAGCSSLTSVTIPDSVTNIGSAAFQGCSGLTSVTIPDNVTSIGDFAFNDCSGLPRVMIPVAAVLGAETFPPTTTILRYLTEAQLTSRDSEQNAAGRVLGQADVTSAPNNYGLYGLSQVQALHVGTPLLAKDSASGKFKLTIGVEKSTNLVNFSPMAIPVGAATLNAQGKMEFQFTSPDNAAFYRLESR